MTKTDEIKFDVAKLIATSKSLKPKFEKLRIVMKKAADKQAEMVKAISKYTAPGHHHNCGKVTKKTKKCNCGYDKLVEFSK